MKTVNVLSLKGIATLTLLAAGYATIGLVTWSNSRPAPPRPQYPHGLSYGDVLRVTRVVSYADILVEE